MARILVSCWSGMGNIGDDWLLRTALSVLEDHEVGLLLEPNAVVAESAAHHHVLRWPQLSLRQITSAKVRDFRRQVKNWDLLLCFGGGWLAADQSIKTLVRWHIRFNIIGVRCVGYGLGIGPFNQSALAVPLARRLVMHFDDLTVRSPADAVQVASLVGVSPTVVGDPVLLDAVEPELHIESRSGVLLAIPRPYRHWVAEDRWTEYAQRMLAVAGELSNFGDQVRFLSFDHPGDTDFWSYFGEVEIPKNVDEALAHIRGARAIVAGRFHAALAAALTGTALLPVSYHHKFDVLRLLGYDPVSVSTILDDITWRPTAASPPGDAAILNGARQEWSNALVRYGLSKHGAQS